MRVVFRQVPELPHLLFLLRVQVEVHRLGEVLQPMVDWPFRVLQLHVEQDEENGQ